MTVYLPIVSITRAIETCRSQLDNVWVSQQLQILNLSFNSARHVTTDELLSRNDLQGYLLVRRSVNSELHLTEGTLSKCPDDMIGTDTLLGLLWGWLNRLLLLRLGAAGIGIGSLVLRAAVIGGGERDGEFLIIVPLVLVRHHSHRSVVMMLIELGGLVTEMTPPKIE
jgi:hypothetical protein